MFRGQTLQKSNRPKARTSKCIPSEHQNPQIDPEKEIKAQKTIKIILKKSYIHCRK